MNSEPPILAPPPIHWPPPPQRKKGGSVWAVLGWCFLGVVTLGLTVEMTLVLLKLDNAKVDTSRPKPAQVMVESTPVITPAPEIAVPIRTEKRTARWDEGGTLMQASMVEWVKADYDNRLATSAQIVRTLRTKEGKPMPGEKEFHEMAEHFEHSLTGMMTQKEWESKPFSNKNVPEMASVLWVLMKKTGEMPE